MNIFSQRCRVLEYTVTTASQGAISLDTGHVGSVLSVSDCLFLLVGIEQQDTVVVRRATKEIRRIARKTATAAIVVNGFSQLANPG